jgi:hypothetical protein
VRLSLAAEIQRRLLPGSYTCEAGQFTLAAWLEPAGNVGGDTFDFSMDRDTLHLSMTDAMGHEVGAPVLATVLVGALRNARRDGMLERNVADVDLDARLMAGAEMHPREAVQQVVQAILEAAGGELKDDAAAMCLDWHGGPPRERTTNSGADS